MRYVVVLAIALAAMVASPAPAATHRLTDNEALTRATIQSLSPEFGSQLLFHATGERGGATGIVQSGVIRLGPRAVIVRVRLFRIAPFAATGLPVDARLLVREPRPGRYTVELIV